jgi:hypothetical protein
MLGLNFNDRLALQVEFSFGRGNRGDGKSQSAKERVVIDGPQDLALDALTRVARTLQDFISQSPRSSRCPHRRITGKEGDRRLVNIKDLGDNAPHQQVDLWRDIPTKEMSNAFEFRQLPSQHLAFFGF